MVHCDKRGSELFCGDRSHTYLFEQGKQNLEILIGKPLIINSKT